MWLSSFNVIRLRTNALGSVGTVVAGSCCSCCRLGSVQLLWNTNRTANERKRRALMYRIQWRMRNECCAIVHPYGREKQNGKREKEKGDGMSMRIECWMIVYPDAREEEIAADEKKKW